IPPPPLPPLFPYTTLFRSLVQVDLSRHPLAVAVCYAARYPDHNGVRWHLPHYDRAGADAAAVADREATDDLGPGTHHDIVAERGMALLALQAGAAERDALEQRDVLADLGRLADDDAHPVIDEEPSAEPGRRMDLDAGQEARHVGDESRGRRPATIPEPVGEPEEDLGVHQDRKSTRLNSSQ